MQTKGRGRNRNRWASPKGGLWFSIILRVKIPPRRILLLQFLAAIALRKSIESETHIDVQLKWPNDLVTREGKLGGILIESRTFKDKLLFAIVGIGINLNLRKSQLPSGSTSILHETKTRQNLAGLLQAIVEELRSRIRMLEDPSSIMEEWWHFCIHRPQLVTINTEDSTVTGITIGLDEEGGLRVETEDHKIVVVREGTLSLSND